MTATKTQEWRLFECAQETGKEGMIAVGDESSMRKLLNSHHSRDRDVWLRAPDGSKILPDPLSPSPAVIEKWREELKQAVWHNEKPIGDMTPQQAAEWAWMAARQSVVIEIANNSCYDVVRDATEVIIDGIESKGYRVEVKS